MNVERHQLAVNPQTKQTDFSHESAYRLLSSTRYNIPALLSCTEAVQVAIVYSERSDEATCSAVKPGVWRWVPRSWVVELTQADDAVTATADSSLHTALIYTVVRKNVAIYI